MVTNVNYIYTKILSNSRLAIKTSMIQKQERREKKIEDVDKKIHNTTGLVKKTDNNTERLKAILLLTTAALNTKSTEIENKILHITSLDTKATLNTKTTEIESKIPNSSFTTETSFNIKTIAIEDKIHDTLSFKTTPELNRLPKISFDLTDKNTLDVTDKSREEIKNFRCLR